jgi:hypothetical protein
MQNFIRVCFWGLLGGLFKKLLFFGVEREAVYRGSIIIRDC